LLSFNTTPLFLLLPFPCSTSIFITQYLLTFSLYNQLINSPEHDGLTKSGEPDKRVGTGEFAHGKVDPHEAGQKGGETGGSAGGATSGSGGSGGTGQFAGGKVDPVEAGRKGGQS
jgi:hypothetical protein